jgi:hypothetical protein
MENETYSNLPLQMNGLQRDATAFGVLTPGAQGGTRLPVIGGTGNYLGQLYIDGMPAETVSQQGDNRIVSEGMDLDSVDQFQVVTSSPPAEYMGAGAENFTMKSGGLKYHGQVSDFLRNTVADNWSFTAKAATTHNAAGATIPAPKPVEHQNELSMSVGGVVPRTGLRQIPLSQRRHLLVVHHSDRTDAGGRLYRTERQSGHGTNRNRIQQSSYTVRSNNQ